MAEARRTNARWASMSAAMGSVRRGSSLLARSLGDDRRGPSHETPGVANTREKRPASRGNLHGAHDVRRGAAPVSGRTDKKIQLRTASGYPGALGDRHLILL